MAVVRASQLKFDKECAEKNTTQKATQEKSQQWNNQIEAFNNLIDQSSDLSDQLQNLNDHLKAGSKATAVYIGKMVQPKKPITDKDNDQAHIASDATPNIHFGFANAEHSFIVDKVLQPGSGVTYELFEDKPVEAAETAEPELDEEGNPVPVPEKPYEETLPKFMIVPEVVREGKIHFFKVPKLGAYMAIRLEYETCLFEEALDAGVADQLAVNEKERHQAEERSNHEKAQHELQEQMEADGEVFKADVKEWETIEVKPYTTRKVQFVCCLNTMGQDRKFTEEEKLFALRTVQRYRDRWEQCERDNLKADIETKITKMDLTKTYKELNEAQDLAELEIRAEASIQQKEGAEPLTEEQKLSLLKKARLLQISKTFYDPEGIIVHQRQLDRDKLRSSAEARVSTPKADDGESATPSTAKYYPLAPEQWKKPFLDLRQLSIIKNPRVLQTLFYLLGYKREQICEPGTNALDFKCAKDLINEQLFEKIAKYNPQGPRTEVYQDFQKLSFLKKNLAECEEDKVEEFSLVSAKILKWIHLAIDIRIENVVKRRDAVESSKQEREHAIKLDNTRKEKYEKELAERKQIFEDAVDAEIAKQATAAKPEGEEGEELAAEVEEPVPANRPEFDERDFKGEFDLANPEHVIPAEVQDEVDNDYDLPYSAPVPAAE